MAIISKEQYVKLYSLSEVLDALYSGKADSAIAVQFIPSEDGEMQLVYEITFVDYTTEVTCNGDSVDFSHLWLEKDIKMWRLVRNVII